MSRPEPTERLAAIETSLRYESRRIDRLETMMTKQTEKPEPPGTLSILDGPALVKLGLAGALVLTMVLLKMVGRPDIAADLSAVISR